MLGQVVHQGWISTALTPMADALRAQLTNGLPDTFRAGRFARVDGDMPPGVAGLVKWLRNNTRKPSSSPARSRAVMPSWWASSACQLFLTGGFAEGAAQNTDQPGVDLEIAVSLLNPGITASTTPSTGSRWVIAI